MIVLVTNNLPDAVRGRLKLWFIEPKPNVFVSGIKDALADKVVQYLFESCGSSSGFLIFKSDRKPPGFQILSKGQTSKQMTSITGLQLIIETIRNPQDV